METWVIRSTSPTCRTAAAESPPPMIVTAFDSASSRATANVPSANLGISNTPSGPFHTIVLAPANADSNVDTVFGPMSSMRQPEGTSLGATTRAWASFSKASATTTSTGRTSRPPAFCMSDLAVGTASSSTRLSPTSKPMPLKNVLAIPPPMSTRSHRFSRRRTTPILSEILAPPRTATKGRAGFSTACAKNFNSLSISSPATASPPRSRMARATPSVEAWAR